MYYELYIDVFFIINFIIDFISLTILKKILHLKGSVIRRLIAAFAAGMFVCLYFIFDLRMFKISFMLMLIITSPVMILISFGFKSVYSFIKTLIFLLVINMCLNGFFDLIIRKTGFDFNLLISAVFAYFIFACIHSLLKFYGKKRNKICEVIFVIGNNEIHTKGIIDTGNCLVSPYHNKGVSVVEYEIFEKYLSVYAKSNILAIFGETYDTDNDFESGDCSKVYTAGENIFAVPYKTISTPHGILPVMAVDKMYIKDDKEDMEYKEALIGFIRGKVSSAGDYNVILSAKL